jgi:threonine/homoserine/homoserine lactone efflux protein
MSSFAIGLGLGLFVGGRPGPVSLLCHSLRARAAAWRRAGERLLATIDVVAGAGLLGFAGLLAYRPAAD